MMALWIITILMILVSNVAMTFIREYKISRLSYDEVIAHASAEWAFEYAMLKSRNHRDGFQDSINNKDPDAQMFIPNSPRSKNLSTWYEMESQSTEHDFELNPQESVAVPLFSGTDDKISENSLVPLVWTGVIQVKSLESTLPNTVNWEIAGMNGSKNISISWTGSISSQTKGDVYLSFTLCSYSSWTGSISQVSENDCTDISGYESATTKEKQIFKQKLKWKVTDFLDWDVEFSWIINIKTDTGVGQQDKKIKLNLKDPYLILYNNGVKQEKITIKTDSPFTLPYYTIIATSRKWDALQIFEFSEHKKNMLDISDDQEL